VLNDEFSTQHPAFIIETPPMPATVTVAFNDTTVTFGQGNAFAGCKIVSVKVTKTWPTADVGGNADTTKYSGAGVPRLTTEVEIVGTAAIAKGAAGALAVGWADGGDFGSMTHAIRTKRGRGGGLGGATTTRYTFRPAHVHA
jgi:hypothetical protein